MNKNLIYAFGIAALVLIWLGSGLVGDRGSDDQGQSSETPAAKRVEVLDIEAGSYQPWLQFNARTAARRAVRLRVETDGVIIATPVKKGTYVEAGTRLAELALEDRVALGREALALAEEAELDYEAALGLHQRELISDTDLAARRSALETARALQETRQLDLEKTRINAPFAGVFNNRFYEVGDFVQRGDELADLLQLDPLKVVFEVSEREIGAIQLGNRILLELSDGRTANGLVTYRSAQADPQSRTFQVEAEVPNPEQALLADLTGTVRVAQAERLAQKIPAALLSLNSAGNLVVKTVDANSRVESHQVSLLADDSQTLWVQGLPNTARLIVSGQEYVGVGEYVEAVARDTPALQIEPQE